MTEKDKKNGREGPWEEWDGEYIGNIWGWKWSFISLGIILFVVSIMVYRHYNLTDEQRQQWEQRLEMQRDSIEAAEQ